jgi:hypothetical protein
VKDPAAENFAEGMNSIRLQATNALTVGQAKQKEYYNKDRSFITFEPGDQVLINPHTLRLLRQQKGKGTKLLMHYDGPFTVKERVSDVSYRLEIPSSYKIHPVINIAHLEPYNKDKSDIERPTKNLSREDFKNHPEYEVEAILKEKWVKKRHRRQKEYLVKFLGYDDTHNLWLNKRALTNAPEILREWEQKKIAENAN